MGANPQSPLAVVWIAMGTQIALPPLEPSSPYENPNEMEPVNQDQPAQI
jgi:hypothetical protein